LIAEGALTPLFNLGPQNPVACGSAGKDYTAAMKSPFTAIVQQDGDWWIGWAKEIPGVHAQWRTRGELMVSLTEALRDILELNAEDALKFASGQYEELALPA